MAEAEENNGGMEKSKPTNAIISIRVKNQNGRETFFKIRRDTPIKKLLLSYCRKHFLEYESTQFYLEAEHFNHTKTSDQLGLDDDVEIESMTEQLGGGGMNSSRKIVLN